MTVRVRRVTEEDCARLPAFRESMEGGGFLSEWRDGAFYRHKCLVAGLACLAERDGRPVALTSATRKLIRMGDDVLPGAELGDLFVAPELRGQGVFRRVHDAVLGELRAEGVKWVTVRPGKEAGEALRRAFGYRVLFRVGEWFAALTDEGLAGLPLGRVPFVSRLLPRARIRAESASFVALPVDPGDLAGPEAFDHGWPVAGTVRDATRLGTRYGDDPAPYRAIALCRGTATIGAAVYGVYRGKGFLIDAWIAGGEEAGAGELADASLAALRDAGADSVRFWNAREAKRDPVARALRAAGLRRVRGSKEVLGRPLDELRPAASARSWLFRMGDTDGI